MNKTAAKKAAPKKEPNAVMMPNWKPQALAYQAFQWLEP